MESLAPPLQCALEVRWAMENGQSLRSALMNYCQSSDTEFAREVAEWLLWRDCGRPLSEFKLKFDSEQRKILLELFNQGLEGLPILPRLHELEQELLRVCLQQIDRQIALLPFQSLIPLLGCQFPAFLILLFGPLLQELQGRLSL